MTEPPGSILPKIGAFATSRELVAVARHPPLFVTHVFRPSSLRSDNIFLLA
jgi:hypothetical protein